MNLKKFQRNIFPYLSSQVEFNIKSNLRSWFEIWMHIDRSFMLCFKETKGQVSSKLYFNFLKLYINF